MAWLRLNIRSIFSLVASQQAWLWLAAFRAWLAVLCAAAAFWPASLEAALATSEPTALVHRDEQSLFGRY